MNFFFYCFQSRISNIFMIRTVNTINTQSLEKSKSLPNTISSSRSLSLRSFSFSISYWLSLSTSSSITILTWLSSISSFFSMSSSFSFSFATFKLRDITQHAHRFFHLGVHVPFYLHFWGCNVPSNSSFGGTKKINCIFSTQGRAPCCFLWILRRVGENFFFLSDIGSERKWGSVWPMAFVSVPPFFVILYITCHIWFFIQKWMQDYLCIVMIIKQLIKCFSVYIFLSKKIRQIWPTIRI